MRVYRERLSAPPGHVIGQGPAPGGRVVPRGGGGESDFPSRKWKMEKSSLSFENIHFFENRLEIDEIRNGYVVGEEMKKYEDLEGS